jgi:hypothetical protein
MFYQYFGIQQVSVNQDTGEYEITLNDDKVGTVIDKILTCMNAEWARYNWSGDGPAETASFAENRVLFLNQVVQNFDHLAGQVGDGFDCGFLPFPKLDTDQENYCTPVAYQSVVMCIPRNTSDRTMSEYFIDVLSWTGEKYVMDAYMTNISVSLPDDESLEMLEDYIFANMIYDQGYMLDWNGLLTDVQSEAYKSGTNKFEESFTNAYEAAATTVQYWNIAWGSYDDEYSGE